MPHIVLETTADLPENSQVPDILEALVIELSRQETINPAAVKAYHGLRSNWHMGEGAPPGFAHVTVKIMSGRPAELRKTISEAMWAVMKEQFAESLSANEVSLTLELLEMDAETYKKL